MNLNPKDCECNNRPARAAGLRARAGADLYRVETRISRAPAVQSVDPAAQHDLKPVPTHRRSSRD